MFSTVVGIDVFSMIGRQYAWHCSKRTGSGNDLSSFTITVHAISVTQISTSASGAVENAGNSNPDSDFRFDATLGSTGGYIFNLKTTGLSTGTYKVNFTVTGDSFVYAANFEIK